MGKKTKKILLEIRQELKRNVDPTYKKGEIRFFKEPIKTYGVRVPATRRISRKYWQRVKGLGKQEIFCFCEELLKSGYMQEATIAFAWALRLQNQYEEKDGKVFYSWLRKYVSNWVKCDDFCTRAFGSFVFQFPEFLFQLNVWAKSKNRWLKRASAVILIYSVRKEKHLNKIFEISDILLEDEDDMVRKGYGWALKEAGNQYQDRVFKYVMKRKHKMPRVAFRYAIEKMPPKMKKQAMEKTKNPLSRPALTQRDG